jgi:6-pyruvoyl-tetrahydropterin synthase related domain
MMRRRSALISHLRQAPLALAEIGCLFAVAGLITARQLTSPHFASCVVDDSILQMSWVRQFAQALVEGTWLPRWLPDSNGGYGSPVFLFYSPLVYYVTAGVYWLGSPVILAMKLVRLLGLFLSGLAMLMYARNLAGRRLALIISVVYLVLPFHVLDVSYWSLYAEPWAWIWFPLILMSFDRMLASEDLAVVPCVAVSYAGLILTHLVSAYMFSFVMAGYALACSRRGRRVRGLALVMVNVGLGLALSAFFLLPAVYERRFVHIEYSTLLPEFDFRNTFLFFPNPKLMTENLFQARTIQLLQWVALLQATGLAVGAVMSWRAGFGLSMVRVLRFALGAALLCFFLMSRASSPLWQIIPGLAQIQFSTRWLSIYTLMSALLIGAGFQGFTQWQPLARGRFWLKAGYLTFVVLAAIASLLIIRGGCFLGDEEFRQASMNVYNAPEYNPQSMPNWRQRVIYPESPPFKVIEGFADVKIRRWAAHERELSVEGDSSILLALRLFDYPGWVLRLDGRNEQIRANPADGGILVSVQPGKHVVHLRFENATWRTASLAVSGVAGLALGVIWLRRRARSPLLESAIAINGESWEKGEKCAAREDEN